MFVVLKNTERKKEKHYLKRINEEIKQKKKRVKNFSFFISRQTKAPNLKNKKKLLCTCIYYVCVCVLV